METPKTWIDRSEMDSAVCVLWNASRIALRNFALDCLLMHTYQLALTVGVRRDPGGRFDKHTEILSTIIYYLLCGCYLVRTLKEILHACCAMASLR